MSYSIDTGDSFPRQKRAERETNYLPNLTIMLCIGGYMPPLLTRLCGVQRHEYIFTLDGEKLFCTVFMLELDAKWKGISIKIYLPIFFRLLSPLGYAIPITLTEDLNHRRF